MADGGFPNRNRADNALTIYRDAMREFLAPMLERKHGPGWIRSQVLNDELRERNPSSYNRRLQSLKKGTPARDLIDLAEIPFLGRNNSDVFPHLHPDDIQRMQQIRDLRNEIQHPVHKGDCTPEEADAVIGLCGLVLGHCGLSDAVKNIRHLSSSAGEEKRRARHKWDKTRLANRPTAALTPWEQERLAEIEWEEEWERRKLQERELSKIARIGGDLGRLDRWFSVDEKRKGRHPATYAKLQKKQELSEIARIGGDLGRLDRWFSADEKRKGRHPATYAKLQKQQREKQELSEIARIGGNFSRLRRWFNADKKRKGRHPATYAKLRKQQREKRELSEIAQIGGDIDRLARWFSAEKKRKGRHPATYAKLQKQQRKKRELSEIAQIGGDIDRLARWFNADEERKGRHASTYAKLRGRELSELSEIAQIGGDIDRLARWFSADEKRKGRHPATYAKLRERELSEIAQIGGDIDRLARWFDANEERKGRHASTYAGLRERALQQSLDKIARLNKEEQKWARNKLAQLGYAPDSLRDRFNADTRQRERQESAAEATHNAPEAESAPDRQEPALRSPSLPTRTHLSRVGKQTLTAQIANTGGPPKRSLLSRIFRR